MTTSAEAFGALLGRVYDAALEPALWPSALKHACEWLGARRALLFTPDTGLDEGGFFYSQGVSAEEMTLWSSRYVGADFWTNRTIERRLDFEGSVILDSDLSTRSELLASDYYREHLSRMRIGWLLGSIVLRPADRSMPWVACSFYREPDDAGFDEASRAKMQLLLPHISRALGVMFRLRSTESMAASSVAVLDTLSFGVLLLDGSGRLTYCNAAANQLLLAGTVVTQVNGTLQIKDVESRKRWAAAVLATLRHGGAGPVSHFSEAVRVADLRGGAYLMQISRLSSVGAMPARDGRARLIVFVSEETRKLLPEPELLRRLYGLTPAEIKCVCVLGTQKVEDAASDLGLSAHTVRTQLKSVYAKTSCSNRAELTKLMLSLASIP